MIQIEMYIGPTIPGVVKNSAVFICGIPNELKEMAKILPSINNLVVSIEKITETKKSLSEPGSVEYYSFRLVEKHLKGEI